MCSKKLGSLFLGALMLSAWMPAAWAQPQAGGAEVLDRTAFINAALANDPAFQTALQQYLQTKYSALSAREVAEWTLGVSAGIGHEETLATGAAGDAVSYEMSLQKLFLPTGTQAALSHSNILEEGSGVRSSTPELTLAITQPLLRNAFGLADRYPVVAAEIQKRAAWDDAVEAWEARILVLEQAYLDWCDAYETLKTYQAIVAELTRLENQVRRKYQSRVSDENDLVQAEANLLTYQSRLLAAETGYLNQTLHVISLRDGQVSAGTDVPELVPETMAVRDLSLPAMTPEEAAALRVVRKFGHLKEQLLHEKAIADNAGLPSLDLMGEVTAKGTEDELNGGYAALGSRKDYSILLQASMPLGNYQAAGDAGRAEAGLAEVEASAAQAQREVMLGARQMEARLAMLEKTLLIQEQLVAKARRKLQLDQRDYEIGRLDIYYLIDAQNGLNNARLNFIQSKIGLENAKLAYLAFVDRLAPQYPALFERLKP